LGIDRPSISYLFFFFIDEPTTTTTTTTKKLRATNKKDKGWIWWWDFFRVIRFSLSNVTKISFESLFLECVHFVNEWLWSFFALWTHPDYVKISAGTFFSSFYDLLSIFTNCFIFLLSSNNFPSLLPLFNSIVATICHMIFSWFDRINLSSLCTDYLLMKRKSQKKRRNHNNT